MTAPKPPILNLADVDFQPRPSAFMPDASTPAAARFGGMRRAVIGQAIGARRLGYNVTAVPPGQAAYPFHSHRVNEEMFFVLQGRGELRLGEAVHPVRAGDFIACVPGDASTAHQLRNTGDEELRYLAVSTLDYPEIAEYPDSGKFGVYAMQRGADGALAPAFVHFGREAQSIDYWDGEGER